MCFTRREKHVSLVHVLLGYRYPSERSMSVWCLSFLVTATLAREHVSLVLVLLGYSYPIERSMSVWCLSFLVTATLSRESCQFGACLWLHLPYREKHISLVLVLLGYSYFIERIMSVWCLSFLVTATLSREACQFGACPSWLQLLYREKHISLVLVLLGYSYFIVRSISVWCLSFLVTATISRESCQFGACPSWLQLPYREKHVSLVLVLLGYSYFIERSAYK